jgi:hypothetical protein
MAQGEISIGIAGRRRQIEKQEKKIKMMHIHPTVMPPTNDVFLPRSSSSTLSTHAQT